jgi:acylphosphatase
MDTRRCVVSGRVQGVGFRWFVTRNAQDLGVRGTVRNRGDGAVEVVLQADEPAAVQALVDRIRRGPPASRVEEVACEPVPLATRLDGFEVVR